jgi:hypothetical protein
MFIDRGLDGLSASALGRCGVYASHDKGYEQLAYAGYKSNIAAFLHATIVKMVMTKLQRRRETRRRPATCLICSISDVLTFDVYSYLNDEFARVVV